MIAAVAGCRSIPRRASTSNLQQQTRAIARRRHRRASPAGRWLCWCALSSASTLQCLAGAYISMNLLACMHVSARMSVHARTHTCLHTGTCTISARGGAPSCRRRWTKPRSSMRSRCMRSGGLAAPAGRRVLHRLRPIGANRSPRRPRCRRHRVWLRKHRGKGGALGGALDKLRRGGWMRSSCLGLVGA